MTLQLATERRKTTPLRVMITIATAAFLGIWIFPFVLIIMTSLKTSTEFIAGPFALPQAPTLSAYFRIWEDLNMGRLLLNTFFYATAGAALAVIMGLAPAFAISRFPIKGRLALFVILLTGMMLPQQTVIIPLYDMLRDLNLLDRPLGLILVHGVYGVNLQVLVLTGFMSTIPRELEYSARVDGASDFGVFWHIILPLSVTAMAVGFTLNFIAIWKEFFFALIFLSSEAHHPVTVGLLKITSPYYFTAWNLPAAALVLAQLPMIVMYILAYRWIAKGIYAGSVKG